MKKYQKRLADKGIQQSMSRRGNYIDNAAMERIFGHVKSELIYLQTFTDIAPAVQYTAGIFTPKNKIGRFTLAKAAP